MLLALGCEDGSVRVFDVSSPGEAVYVKALMKHQARVLSIDWKEGVLVSGGADGSCNFLGVFFIFLEM